MALTSSPAFTVITLPKALQSSNEPITYSPLLSIFSSKSLVSSSKPNICNNLSSLENALSLKWRTRASFFSKGKDVQSLKDELFDAIAPLDRGAEATRDDQERVDQVLWALVRSIFSLIWISSDSDSCFQSDSAKTRGCEWDQGASQFHLVEWEMGAFIHNISVTFADKGVVLFILNWSIFSTCSTCLFAPIHQMWFLFYFSGICLFHIYLVSVTEAKILKTQWKNLPGNQSGYSSGSKFGNLAIL